MIDRRDVVTCLLAFAACLPAWAQAQVLYKLIDRQGRVTYSDSEPKNFDGRVIRLEPDSASNVVPSGKAGEGTPRTDAKPGMAESRRQSREDLDRKLRAAQARAEAARKAKDDGASPLPEEMQTVQRRYAPLRPGQEPPRANCFPSVDPNGVASLVCPMQTPQESYYERLKKLDEELQRAEEELQLAERAYRRGTD